MTATLQQYSFGIIDGQIYSNPTFGVLPKDGISDLWQNTYEIDPFWPMGHPLHSDSDLDGDLVTNIDEYFGGTDPYDPNSFLFSNIEPSTLSGEFTLTLDLTAYYDYSLRYTETLLSDFTEIDALVPTADISNYGWTLTTTGPDTGFWRVSVMPADSDDDGLLDFEEIFFVGTDPLVSDVDGDGVLDGVEFAQGSDPQNRSDSFDNGGQLYYNSPFIVSFLRMYADADFSATNPTITGTLERVGSPNQFLIDQTLSLQTQGVLLDIGANLLAQGTLYDYTVSYTNLTTPQPFRYKILLPHEYRGGTTQSIAIEIVATPPTIEQVPGLLPAFLVASSSTPTTRFLYGAITLQVENPNILSLNGLLAPTAPANAPLMEVSSARDQVIFTTDRRHRIRLDLPVTSLSEGVVTLIRSSTDYDLYDAKEDGNLIFSGSALTQSWDLSNSTERSNLLALLYPPNGTPNTTDLQQSVWLEPIVESPDISSYDEALTFKFSYSAQSSYDATNDAFNINNYVNTTRTAIQTIDILLLKMDLELEKEVACDGETVDIDIIAHSSITSLISNVTFRAEKPDGSTDFNGLNPDNQGLTFSQRGEDITEWQVDNVRWYSTQNNHCNPTSDYQIIVEITLGGQTIEIPAVTLTADTSYLGESDSVCFFAEYTFSGIPNIWDGQPTARSELKSDGYHVTFSGNVGFKKNIKGNIINGLEPNSQFYHMAQAEEEFHKLQFQGNGGVGISSFTSDLYLAEDVIAELDAVEPVIVQNEEDVSDAAVQAIVQAMSTVFADSEALRNQRLCNYEREAKEAIGASFRVKMECAYPQCSN